MKKIVIFSVFLITLLGLTACGSKNASNNNSLVRRQLDFGQPERSPDIVGIIKSITGNEITILKVEMPNSRQKMNADGAEDSKNKTPSVGTGVGMRPGRFGGTRTNVSEEDRASMAERLKEFSTGEEKITVPVGIRMLKRDINSKDKQPKMLEATLEDLKKDKMIRVWLNSEITDRSIAEFVLVL